MRSRRHNVRRLDRRTADRRTADSRADHSSYRDGSGSQAGSGSRASETMTQSVPEDGDKDCNIELTAK